MAKLSPYYCEVTTGAREGGQRKLAFWAAIKGPGNMPLTRVALLKLGVSLECRGNRLTSVRNHRER
jgi:hypothetical protein